MYRPTRAPPWLARPRTSYPHPTRPRTSSAHPSRRPSRLPPPSPARTPESRVAAIAVFDTDLVGHYPLVRGSSHSDETYLYALERAYIAHISSLFRGLPWVGLRGREGKVSEGARKVMAGDKKRGENGGGPALLRRHRECRWRHRR